MAEGMNVFQNFLSLMFSPAFRVGYFGLDVESNNCFIGFINQNDTECLS